MSIAARATLADLSVHRLHLGQMAGALILLATVARLLFALGLGLGVDESYMVAAGRQWHLSYFDHPPLAWWLASGAAWLAGSESALIVRLPFIALFAASTWLMYRLGAALFGARAGLWAALVLNLSPVFGLTTGTWVLPDGPLDAALLAAALCLVHALPGGRGAWHWWLGAGAAAGLALLSKYSAGLVIAGALLYLLTQGQHRAWLRRPHPYAAALVAAALFAPVLAWNATHHWASFGFQGGRAGIAHLNPLGPVQVLAGEALFILPWIWTPLAVAFIYALRAGPAAWRSWLLCCLGIVPIALFAIVGLWSKHVLFHWAAPGYLMLFPLLGEAIERWRPRALRAVVLGTVALILAGIGVIGTELRWNWLPLAPLFAPRPDPALQALDWTALRPALQARGLLDRPGTVLAATDWREAGKLDYALGGAAPLIVLNRDAREYGIAANAAGHAGEDALILTTKLLTPTHFALQGYAFAAFEELPPLTLPMAGERTLMLRVYLGRKLRVAAQM